MTELHETVIRRLEDAGRTLQMLPMPKGGMPQGDGAAWPDVLQDSWDIEEPGDIEAQQTALAAARNRVILRAGREAIQRLDEVLEWLMLIPKDKPHWRKAVMGRMLTHPVSERPVHSWAKIAVNMGTNESTVRYWHGCGVQLILDKLAGVA